MKIRRKKENQKEKLVLIRSKQTKKRRILDFLPPQKIALLFKLFHTPETLFY